MLVMVEGKYVILHKEGSHGVFLMFNILFFTTPSLGRWNIHSEAIDADVAETP